MGNKFSEQDLRIHLNADQFYATAKSQTGLSDFGSDRFYDSLKKLLSHVAQDVDFHPEGLEIFKANIVHWLVNTLRIEDDLKRQPEILQEDVSDPIIVIGLGRSGTTKLHKMLSAPDSVQKTLLWRLYNPGRFPDAQPGQPDPRIAAAGGSHFTSEDRPEMDAAHHMEPMEVDEEWMLYLPTFESWGWTTQFHSPQYTDWVQNKSNLEAFQHVKKVLQYLQWQDGGKRNRPWVMKTVGYLADIDSLMACYPNATLVHAHRDPRSTIASWSKLEQASFSVMTNPIDPKVMGEEMVRTWSRAMGKYLAMREQLALDEKIVDVSYEQIRSDPMKIMKEVYQRANLTMSAEAEKSMQDWHDSNEQGKYGKHQYSLEEFGLSNAIIDEAFKDYIHRFIDR